MVIFRVTSSLAPKLTLAGVMSGLPLCGLPARLTQSSAPGGVVTTSTVRSLTFLGWQVAVA